MFRHASNTSGRARPKFLQLAASGRRPTGSRRPRWGGITAGRVLLATAGGLGIGLVAVGAGAVPALAAGGSFTWTGAGTSPNWSVGANWQGGTAPSGSVASLSFPAASCPSACYGLDDETLTTGSLSFDSNDIIQGTDTLTVGTGGLSAATPSGSATATVGLDLPLALSGDQTWNITGATLGVAAPVTGSGSLAIDVSGGGNMVVIPGGSGAATVDSEVGPMTITGSSTTATGVSAGQNGGVALEASGSSTQAELNATDGQPINVFDAVFGGAGTTGPVSLSGSDLAAGVPESPAGTLQVNGGITLDSSSALTVPIVGAGTTAGTDYGQVTSTGGVALDGATLQVEEAGSCPVPALGTTYTLLSTTGTLSGTFSSPSGGALPNDATVPLAVASGSNCAPATDALQIAYNTTASPATVTATVVAASANSSPTAGAVSTTKLTASPTTATTGSPVTFTATVSPTPTSGTVAFDLGSTAPLSGCGAVALDSSGSATCTTNFTGAGTEQVYAVYSGDATEASSTSSAVSVSVTGKTGTTVVGTPPPSVTTTPGSGYAEATRDGWVFVFGSARYFGSLPSSGVHVDDIVGLAPTIDGGGYWLAGADGGVFAFGDAPYLGSVPGAGVHVDDVVGMVAAPGGRGYWLVGAHGGVYAFGDAPYLGSLPGLHVQVDDVAAVAP